MANPLPRSAPETQGIASSTILEFLESAEEQIHELHSVMIVRHGSVVAEGWWSPYRAENPHMLFSLSKSFTSTAVGLAVAEGLLSVEDEVISFFPDETPADVSDNLAAMRVRHLLSMSTGHAKEAVLWARQDGNWIKAFLEEPVVYEPGTHFLYNTPATYMLSAIVQKRSGMMLLDYLQPRILEPLGIENATWEVSPQGIHTGGWGMNIKTEDIARFGQMYLQKGVWQGQQLVPQSWVEQATSKQVSNGTHPENDWEQGYGFQFWRCRHNAYRGDGAFGQFCIVMPDQDAVVAMTSGVGNMQQVLNLVWDCLLPAMSDAPLPADAAAHEALARKQSSLTLTPPQGRSSSPAAALVSGQTYQAEANQLDLQTVSVDFSAPQAVVTVTTSDGDYRLVCGDGVWQAGTRPPFDFVERPPVLFQSPIAASGVWTAEDTFTVTVHLYETPFYQTLNFRFTGDQLALEVLRNLTFVPETHSIAARRT